MSITYSDVYELIQPPTDVKTTNQTMITNLIARMTAVVENAIGRKVSSTAFSDILFSHGVNCEIYRNELFLTGIYRDIYSISAITELGVTLALATSYASASGYYPMPTIGKLVRIGGEWSPQDLAIKMSGSLGIGGASGASDLKQAIIEMVAAKSGLWRTNIQIDGGSIQSIKTNVSDDAKAILASYGFKWSKNL